MIDIDENFFEIMKKETYAYKLSVGTTRRKNWILF